MTDRFPLRDVGSAMPELSGSRRPEGAGAWARPASPGSRLTVHRSGAHGAALLLCVVLLASPAPVEAQRHVELPATPTCSSCAISARRTAVISDEAALGEPLDGLPFSMDRAPDGRVYMISAQFRPLVFDPGTDSLRPFARRGGGPGEFKMPTRLFVRRDGRLVMLDPAQLRLTVFTRSGEPASTRPIPGKLAPQAVLLDDSIVVYNASFNSAGALGLPFHTLGREGGIARSFGPRVELRIAGDAAGLRHPLASASGRHFWAADELRYQISEWSADGQLVRTLTRHAPWFPESDHFEAATPDRPFTPFVTAVHQDAADRLWVLIAIPDAQYASGLGEARRGRDGQPRYPIASYTRHYDTVVEVIDPDAGRVLVSQRLPRYIPFFLDDTHVASYDEDGSGSPRVEIWQLSLTGAASRR
jgi:hypothetical protein